MEALGAGEIEIGFVYRGHFDHWGKSRQDGGDLVAPLGIYVVLAFEEDGVWAEAACGAKRHRGMDAETAGFVARRGNYAAAIGLAADHYGLAAKFGVIEQFDGDEEGVHVYVKDRGGLAGEGSDFVLCAELGLAWAFFAAWLPDKDTFFRTCDSKLTSCAPLKLRAQCRPSRGPSRWLSRPELAAAHGRALPRDAPIP